MTCVQDKPQLSLHFNIIPDHVFALCRMPNALTHFSCWLNAALPWPPPGRSGHSEARLFLFFRFPAFTRILRPIHSLCLCETQRCYGRCVAIDTFSQHSLAGWCGLTVCVCLLLLISRVDLACRNGRGDAGLVSSSTELDLAAREALSAYDCGMHKHFCDLESTRCQSSLAGGYSCECRDGYVQIFCSKHY